MEDIKPPKLNTANTTQRPETPGNEPGSAINAASDAASKGVKGVLGAKKDGLENKLEKEAVKVGSKAIGSAVTAATGAAGAALGKAAEWLSNKILPALMQFQKKFAKALPYVLVLNLIIIFMIGSSGVGFASRALKGAYGKTLNQNASAYNSDDLADAQLVLGSQKSLNNLESWYFNQADPKWGGKPGQTGGWAVNSYASRACALSSAAMIAKYYGLENVNPYIFGGYIAKKAGDMRLDPGNLATFMNQYGLNKKMVAVPKTIEAIRSEIMAGNPILAHGNTAFGASAHHWVVIAGVSDDGKYFILNDPSPTKSLGKPGRPSSTRDMGVIQELYAYHEK